MAIPDKNKVKAAANKIAQALDADVLVFNFGIEPGIDGYLLDVLKKRSAPRGNLLLFLTTEGGDADSAYRIARHLQDRYSSGKFSIVVSSWCKSAGTLVCTGANELIVGPAGELGPLDVQIAKADELGERSSGLAIEAAFEKLQQESTKLFLGYLEDIKGKTGGRITFKTAAEMSASMVVGMMSGIFEKIDPLVVGEDYRSNLVAEQYAVRLNLVGRNLRQDGLFALCSGYPSHRFVIDRAEAANLFRNVSEPSPEISELISLLGPEAVVPRNDTRNQRPLLEFLNDEQNSKPATGKPGTPTARRANGTGSGSDTTAAGTPSPNVSGGASASPKQKRSKQPPSKGPS